ncbi:BSD domain-containing protein [Plasmodiophora brassicae]|uniref:BSD domain-containing protein n=1 Tax=Plasmodiophora brassicae TaxID=37360 RepID=A0A0G4IQV8_PLABS|nr:hypothetical protein PBRA_000945 [Plasmodiophora brassicae]SPQ97898.1 unnamed protein product [Plasmodiophora brassicae]
MGVATSAAAQAGRSAYDVVTGDDALRDDVVAFYDALLDEFAGDDNAVFAAFAACAFLPDEDEADLERRLQEHGATCQAAVRVEPRIAQLRYRLVPSRISETMFWRQFLNRFLEFAMAGDQQRVQRRPEEPAKAQEHPEEPAAVPVRSPTTSQAMTLLTIPEVFVYRLPPRTSSSGYFAQSWGLASPAWQGGLRAIVHSPGHVLQLRLYDTATGAVFANSDLVDLTAICRTHPASRQQRLAAIQYYIEPALDTSRYYVVRFRNGETGQVALLGVGFRDRSTAFDFNAAVRDELGRCERELGTTGSGDVAADPRKDMAAPEPEAITVDESKYKLPVLESFVPSRVPSALSPPRQPSMSDDADDDDDFGGFVGAAQRDPSYAPS